MAGTKKIPNRPSGRAPTGILLGTTLLLCAFAVAMPVPGHAAEGEHARHIDYPAYPPAPAAQTRLDADKKSAGCVSCHTASDAASMHVSPAVVLGCTDCHGGSGTISAPILPASPAAMIPMIRSRTRALRNTYTAAAIATADTNITADFPTTAKTASAALPSIAQSSLLPIFLS